MKTRETIDNSLKGFRETLYSEIDIPKKETCSKKMIIISVCIAIILISLTIFLIYYFVLREKEKEKIICEPGYYLPDDDPTRCLKCSSEYCQTCSGTKNHDICKICFLGYSPHDSNCEIAHSIKAIYNTTENDETVYFMHSDYARHIKEIYIDNKNITPINTEFKFEQRKNMK